MTSDAEPAFLIKICGITNEEDARHAIENGANALGFNFSRTSPRHLTPERAHEIVTAVEGSYRKVGIFVDATAKELQDAGRIVPLDTLQLHGSIPDLPAGFHIWRAVSAQALPKNPDPRVEAYLIDSAGEGHGGSGKTFDWSLAESFPYRKIVAGGLNESNAAEAIRACAPWGIDACSCLEAHPGKKDPDRVRNFLRAILAVANQDMEL